MGNLLRGLLQNFGDVANSQVVDITESYGIDNTDLNRFFGAFDDIDKYTDDDSVVEKTNVLMIQPATNGNDDILVYEQFTKMNEDLYDNKEWDIMLCKNVEDAASQLSQRKSKVDTLAYLHHGGQWGYMPAIALSGSVIKDLLTQRNDFLINNILKKSGDEKMTREVAMSQLSLSLIDASYNTDFVQKKMQEVDTDNWAGLTKAFFGLEKLFKNIRPNGNFIDASCNQGSYYDADSKEHTVIDTLRLLSFEKFNIYLNTNATLVGKKFDTTAEVYGSKFKANLGFIMNDYLTSDFEKDKRGWIRFNSASKQVEITGKDIILYGYKKPCFVLQSWIKPENRESLRKARTLWFSKKYRKWVRDEIRKHLFKIYKSQPTEDVLDKWFDQNMTKTKFDAKL